MWNAIRTFSISFLTTSCQIVLPFSLSNYAVIPTLRDFNPKLVGPLVVSFGDGRYDAAALLQDMLNPPNKGRVIMQILGNSILGSLHRVAFLEIYKSIPACCSIFPFNAQVPTLGCFADLFIASMFDEHICVVHCMSISLVIHNAVHQIELISCFITLCIHILGDRIYSVSVTAAIGELNFIGSCI
jgi:hypothetical protein